MSRRYYSSVAAATTLTASLTAGGVDAYVVATTGFPATMPFTVILEQNTANEEVATVTALVGLHLTITRGVDGSVGVAHAIGATVIHGVSARDFDEPNSHVNTFIGVHGIAGSVVGTSDTQTLAAKTLTTPTIGDFTNANHTHVAVASGGVLPSVAATQGRKNMLDNAVGFPINQRGVVAYTASGYTADRWDLTWGAGAAGSVSVGTSFPGSISGFSTNYLAWSRGVAGAANSTLEQRVEDVSTFAGQTVTLSIACYSTSAIDFFPTLVQNFGTGGGPSATVTTAGATQTLAAGAVTTLTWTFAVPSMSGKTIGTTANTSYLSMVLNRAWNATNGATGQINIYAIQLELGSVATAFETPRQAETLMLCQRYYWRQIAATNNDFFASGFLNTASNAAVNVVFPVTMRAIPTYAVSAAGALSVTSTTNFVGTASVASAPSTRCSDINITVAGAVAGQGLIAFLNTAGAWIEFSADL